MIEIKKIKLVSWYFYYNNYLTELKYDYSIFCAVLASSKREIPRQEAIWDECYNMLLSISFVVDCFHLMFHNTDEKLIGWFFV